MNNSIYPLKQVLEIKIRRVDDQEKVVKEKKSILEQEKIKLTQRETERDKVLKHYKDKLTQMREVMDAGTTSPKIQQMKVYIKVVKERLKVEEKKVKDQKDQVDAAEKNLMVAQNELKLKRQEVDKLKTHRVDWEKTARLEQEVVDAREQDELGNVMFLGRKMRDKRAND